VQNKFEIFLQSLPDSKIYSLARTSPINVLAITTKKGKLISQVGASEKLKTATVLFLVQRYLALPQRGHKCLLYDCLFKELV
jgi:hypothetical protein